VAHWLRLIPAEMTLFLTGPDNATYVFAKPRNMETFLTLYTKITRDDIRGNRGNAAERLGFLGRVIHGTNPRVWLKEVRQHVGEGIDFEIAIGV